MISRLPSHQIRNATCEESEEDPKYSSPRSHYFVTIIPLHRAFSLPQNAALPPSQGPDSRFGLQIRFSVLC